MRFIQTLIFRHYEIFFLPEIVNKWRSTWFLGTIKKRTTGPILTIFSQTDAHYSRVYSIKIWRWFKRIVRYENVLLPDIVSKWRSICFLDKIKQKLLNRFSRNFRRQTHNILEYIPLKFGDDSRRCVTMKIFSFKKLSIKDGVIDFRAQLNKNYSSDLHEIFADRRTIF